MSDHFRYRNLAVALVIVIAYTVPALFLSPQTMLDIVSVPMLVFGLWSAAVMVNEAWEAFWSGDQSRAALGLMGLFSIFISIIIMRPYGIIDRNVPSIDWLSSTHIFPVALTFQAVGLFLFSRASQPPIIEAKRGRWGKLVLGIVIGILVGSSKLLEPAIAVVAKVFSSMLSKF